MKPQEERAQEELLHLAVREIREIVLPLGYGQRFSAKKLELTLARIIDVANAGISTTDKAEANVEALGAEVSKLRQEVDAILEEQNATD